MLAKDKLTPGLKLGVFLSFLYFFNILLSNNCSIYIQKALHYTIILLKL